MSRAGSVRCESLALTDDSPADFGTIDWAELQWPNYMDIDWVRLYQKGDPKIGCNPSDYPTEDYINRHMEAYT